MRLKHGIGHFAASLRALALLMLLPTLCQAGGFALYEYGARANAMGGANIALADDASAVAYNPAGITQLPGTHIMFGATAIAPTADVRAGADKKTTTQTNVYLPPHAYLTYQAGERAWIGLGMFTRFGVGTQYGYDWTGKNNVYRVRAEHLFHCAQPGPQSHGPAVRRLWTGTGLQRRGPAQSAHDCRQRVPRPEDQCRRLRHRLPARPALYH